MPEWYQNLLAFLSANSYDANNVVSPLFLMGASGSGLSPLFDFLKPDEAAGKKGWDRLSGLMSGTKALDKLNEDEISTVESLIRSNSLYVVKKASPYGTVMPVRLAEDNTVSFGAEENAKDRIDDDYKWLMKEHGYSVRMQGESLSHPYIMKHYEEEAIAFTEKYGLPPYVKNFFINAEIDPALAERLPFLKNVTDEQEKTRLMKEYFTDIMQNPEEYLTPEERKVLDDEEIPVKDIRVLAFTQGVTLRGYMNRLRGIEALPEIDTDGQAPAANRKSENEILDEAVESVNRNLRNAAKNPVERELTETVIRLKEASFDAERKGPEMERLFAKVISLKAAQNYLGLKPGEEIAEDDPRNKKINMVLAAEQPNTEKIYRDETFRYYVAKLGMDGLAALSRGSDRKPLNDAYNEFCRAQKDKILTEPMHALDYTIIKCDYLRSKRIFFPDKATSSDTWIVPPKNPFGLSYDRTSVVTLAFGKMVEQGYKAEDILDADKLADEKIRTGKEAFSQYQIDTPENAQKLIDTYFSAYEECIRYANAQLASVKSIHPAVIAQKKDGDAFLAVGNYMKDAYQELGTLMKNIGFTPDQEDRFKRLANEGEMINYFFAASRNAADGVKDLNSPEKVNSSKIFHYFTTLECADDIFRRTKKEAANAGQTLSAYLVGQYEKSKGSPDTDAFKLTGATSIALNANANAGVDRIQGNVNAGKKYQQKAAEDFMDGTFRKAVHVKLGSGLNAETGLAGYFGQFRAAPAAENDAAVLR